MKKILALFVLFTSLNCLFADDTEQLVIKKSQRQVGDSVIDYEIETVTMSPMKTLGKNAFWGGSLGFLVGLATHVIVNPKRGSENYFRYPTSIGVYAGSAYGIYSILKREDLYVDASVKGIRNENLSQEELKNIENEKRKKVYTTVRQRLDSPFKSAFYDSLWGGLWGCMMSGSTTWLFDIGDERVVENMFRFGLGGGILLGLTSSLLYNFIQRERIDQLGDYGVLNKVLAFYNPSNESWNLGLNILF